MTGSIPRAAPPTQPGDARGIERPPTIRAVGFNPFRQQRTSVLDAALVLGFVVIIVALVLWGFFG